MYYVTIEASTTAGNVNVSSDGVRVLDVNQNLTGIYVFDGSNCTGKVFNGKRNIKTHLKQ